MSVLYNHGGSPIGNSRVKLTNVADCEKRGLIKKGENPLEIAANQLVKDNIDVLHTIGGDDTNTTAADLANYLSKNNYNLIVVGLPKTIDNDVIPIKQSLGAWTAAEEGANYFHNVVSEHNANPRMLIVHEVMGRNCGWLTAYTAKIYREKLDFVRKLLDNDRQWVDITDGALFYHANYVRPSWRKKFKRTTEIDKHIFYRWDKK